MRTIGLGSVRKLNNDSTQYSESISLLDNFQVAFLAIKLFRIFQALF